MAGDTTERGYGNDHQKVRAQWAPVVDNGEAWCAEVVCLEPSRWIRPGTPWDLAHNRDRTSYLEPAHPRCNRSEGSRRGNRLPSSRPCRPTATAAPALSCEGVTSGAQPNVDRRTQ